MLMLEYSDNYSMTSEILQNYHKDEMNDDANESNAGYYMIDNSKTATNKSLEYNTKITGNMPVAINALDTEVFFFIKIFE